MVKAVVPDWQDPIFRFLRGCGELQVNNQEGKAFSRWEALVYFKDEEYPLEVNGKEFSKDDLIFAARGCFEGDEGLARKYIGNGEDLERFKLICGINNRK